MKKASRSLVAESLIRSAIGLLRRKNATRGLRQIQRRHASDLENLAQFIYGEEDSQGAKLLALEEDIQWRAARLFPSFQGPFLRGELLLLIINLRRDEINDLLRSYKKGEHNVLLRRASPEESAIQHIEHHGDWLNLLHRLVLVMIYREGYAAHVCSAMLGCRDHIVEMIHDDSLTRLSAERVLP